MGIPQIEGLPVSVVIPAYNAQETIEAAIQSVLAQTVPPLEIIVVDDGSTDETAERVRRVGERVRYLRQAHAGPAAARNRGAGDARGELIAFLDADDLWLPEKLERQAAVFQHQPGVEAVQCSAFLVNDSLEVLEERRCRPGRDALLDILLFRNLPAFSSTLIVRKAVFEAVGGFPSDVSEEAWETACRLSRRGTLRSLPEPLVLYRQHAGNRSQTRMDMAMFRDSGFRCLNRVFADPTLPASIRRCEPRIWARFFAMLAGGHLRRRQWREALQWTLRALIISPAVIGYIAGLPVRRLHRAWTVRRKRSLVQEMRDASLRRAGAPSHADALTTGGGISRRLLSLVCCPACGGDLTLTSGHGGGSSRTGCCAAGAGPPIRFVEASRGSSRWIACRRGEIPAGSPSRSGARSGTSAHSGGTSRR
jgi:GT2 family glycosyltransferase